MLHRTWMLRQPARTALRLQFPSAGAFPAAVLLSQLKADQREPGGCPERRDPTALRPSGGQTPPPVQPQLPPPETKAPCGLQKGPWHGRFLPSSHQHRGIPPGLIIPGMGGGTGWAQRGCPPNSPPSAEVAERSAGSTPLSPCFTIPIFAAPGEVSN